MEEEEVIPTREKELKTIKIVLGYNYYITSPLNVSPIEDFQIEYTITEFYRKYINNFRNKINKFEKNLIKMIYLNKYIEINDTDDIIHNIDLKTYFKNFAEFKHIILTKATNEGRIYTLTSIDKLKPFYDKYNLDKKLYEGYCNLELSDKLLERFDNECSQRDDKQN